MAKKKRRPVGRPKASEALVIKAVRVKQKQWNAYKRKAKRAGLTLNAWIRDRLDNAD